MPELKPHNHYAPEDWSAFVDAELTDERRREMDEHLEKCAECSELVRSFRSIQRGAEELAMRSPSLPSPLRPRVLSIGAPVVQRGSSPLNWKLLLACGLILAVGLLWLTSWPPSTDQPVVTPPALPPAQSSDVELSLGVLEITRFLVASPNLDYDVTIKNNTRHILRISHVRISDPFGDLQIGCEPSVVVGPQQSLQHFFSRPVGEENEVVPGVYRITLVTNKGTYSSELRVLKPE